MNRTTFEQNGIYHVYNRGTDKRNIFMDHGDYRRFMRCILHLNDENAIRIEELKDKVTPCKDRKELVEILAFCLIPNHYHLLIKEIKIGGITKFMRKVGTAYTVYFNKRYQRNGVLFQGSFRSIVIDSDSYLHYIPHYIHLNSLDLSMPAWREGKADAGEAFKYLDSYRWSSYSIYGDNSEVKITDQELNNIVNPGFINELYRNNYRAELKDWIRSMDLSTIKGLLLE